MITNCLKHNRQQHSTMNMMNQGNMREISQTAENTDITVIQLPLENMLMPNHATSTIIMVYGKMVKVCIELKEDKKNIKKII